MPSTHPAPRAFSGSGRIAIGLVNSILFIHDIQVGDVPKTASATGDFMKKVLLAT